jgi:hypothetical protein
MLRLIVSELWRLSTGQCARGIETYKIGGGRLRKRHNKAVGAGDKKQGSKKLDRKQRTPVSDEALAIEHTAK